MLVPKLVTTLKTYSLKRFLGDCSAGVIVGIVALPLAIAFAIASGVSPERGLTTAIVAGFLISALGGSRVQIGGPTGAFVVIVYAIVEKYGLSGLTVATIMAGVMLIAMGLLRLGGLIKYIPYPIVTGFTSGIAVIIFSSQVKDALGLRMGAVPSEFIDKWSALITNFPTYNLTAVGVMAGSFLLMALWPKVTRRIPGSLVAILVTTAVVQFFHLDVETIHSRFGEITSSLSSPQIPALNWALITGLIGPATTIALLGSIESLLSAVVADGMIGGRHRSNMELVAQGVANIASPLFGGIPATGAIARTATNIKNGGRTPVAGIVHAVVLFLIMLLFGRWAALIPLATLAAILISVAYTMSEHEAFVSILRGPRSDGIILVSTFLLTVLVDLTVAIEIGMILAAFLFMKQMADTTSIKSIKADLDDEDDQPDPNAADRRSIPAGVEVFEINGPFFFGAVDKFHYTLTQDAAAHKVLILRMRNVPYMDVGGLHALEEVHAKCAKNRIQLFISDIHTQPLVVATQSGFMDRVGEDRFFGNLDDALHAARTLLGLPETPVEHFAPTVAREKKETAG